jgi:hypothetical protein
MHCGDGIQNAEFLPKAQTVFPALNLAVPGGLSAIGTFLIFGFCPDWRSTDRITRVVGRQ